MPGLLDYLYPKGWQGGLLGYGNAAADQVGIDQERGGLLSMGRNLPIPQPGMGYADAIMHKPMDNPMGFAMGTSNVGKPIRAFHGSPYDFDRFDLSKIGTGEGAQAYGHGLYFAENEGVARGYRDALNPAPFDLKQMADPYLGLPDAEAISKLAVARRQAEFRGDKRAARDYRDLSEWFQSGRAADFRPGRMYEVNLHADPNKFLDWDTGIPRQPEPVKEAIEKLGVRQDFPNASGAHLYQALEDRGMIMDRYGRGKPGVTAALQDAGIPGIKYLDQGSRGAGDGTRNFVVFDPKIIEIVRKYGLGALGLTGLLGAQEGEQGQ